jgi:hypothetical protein
MKQVATDFWCYLLIISFSNGHHRNVTQLGNDNIMKDSDFQGGKNSCSGLLARNLAVYFILTPFIVGTIVDHRELV